MTNKEKEEIRKKVIEVYDQEEAVNAELAIRRLYYKWIISFDTDFKCLSDIIETNSLKKEYESLSEKFIDDPCFLFFIGYILDVEPWTLITNYEDDMDAFDVMGYQYMMKANKLNDKVNIYKWGATTNPNEKQYLASKILLEPNQFPLNDKIMGKYFERIFRSQI